MAALLQLVQQEVAGISAETKSELGLAVHTSPFLVPVACVDGSVLQLGVNDVPEEHHQVRLVVDITMACQSPYGAVHDSHFEFTQQTHRVTLTFSNGYPAKPPKAQVQSPIEHYLVLPRDSEFHAQFFYVVHAQLHHHDAVKSAPTPSPEPLVMTMDALADAAPPPPIVFSVCSSVRTVRRFLEAPLELYPKDPQVPTAESLAQRPQPPKKERKGRQARHNIAFRDAGDAHFEMMACMLALRRHRRHTCFYDDDDDGTTDAESSRLRQQQRGAVASGAPGVDMPADRKRPKEGVVGGDGNCGGGGGGGSAGDGSASDGGQSAVVQANQAVVPMEKDQAFDVTGTWLAPELRAAMGWDSSGVTGGDGGGDICGSAAGGTNRAPESDPPSQLLRELLREEAPGVYSFPLFTDTFCRLLIEELDAIAGSGVPVQRPNSMNNYGVILNLVGMKPLFTRLQHQVWRCA